MKSYSLVFCFVFLFAGLAEARRSICGEEDNRVLSQDPYTGRMLKSNKGTAPCTGALISNSCMISAGHCLQYLRVVEFNTLPSEGGKIQHASAADQYVVDRTSIVHQSNGPGQDWAVFKIKKHETTKLFPGEAQGGYFEVDLERVPEKGDAINIYGYGYDSEPDKKYAQQFSTGPVTSVKESLSSIQHQADTMGGSSGSAVLDASTNKIIGVHVWAGCRRNSNQATSLALNAKFKKAVIDCLAN